jgi:Helix-turn-helix domain
MQHIIQTRRDGLIMPFADMLPTTLNSGAVVQLPPVSNDQRTVNKLPSQHDTSAYSARAVIVHALQISPQTTIDFRERWGIMSPAQRIAELRQVGHIIISRKVDDYTADGVKHGMVAKYDLLQLAPQHINKQPIPMLAANDDGKPEKQAA